MTREAVQNAVMCASYVAAFRTDLAGPKSCGQDMLCVCAPINSELHTMPKARGIKMKQAIAAFRELSENAKLHVFCDPFGWIFSIMLFLLVLHFFLAL